MECLCYEVSLGVDACPYHDGEDDGHDDLFWRK